MVLRLAERVCDKVRPGALLRIAERRTTAFQVRVSEFPTPRQLRAVPVRRRSQGNHRTERGGLSRAQRMVQQSLAMVSLVHWNEVVGKAEFLQPQVETKGVDRTAPFRQRDLDAELTARKGAVRSTPLV